MLRGVLPVAARLLLIGFCFATLSCFAIASLSAWGAQADERPAGYAEAENAFNQLTLDQRIELQLLLTTAGYWPAVPNQNFSGRLFDAITRFQIDSAVAPTGILTAEEFEHLFTLSTPLIKQWGFQKVRHPTQDAAIWVPLGLGLILEPTASGLKYSDPAKRLLLTYDYFPTFSTRRSYEALMADFISRGFKIYYSKVYKDEFFVVSMSDGKTDAYVRYHQTWEGGLGFSLYWSHDATDIHVERIATLISGSLWSVMTGAPFADPFVIKPPAATVASHPTVPANPPPTAATPSGTTTSDSPPSQGSTAKPQEQAGGTSGTGFFITHDGLVLTNAHVVKGCSEIHVTPTKGSFFSAEIVALDKTNDLALLKTAYAASRIAQLRTNTRLGEGVDAFGYPLNGLLATSGNFTLGNVSALVGLSDDSRYLQVSTPVQPGNSGEPLLDQNGNLVGIVSAKLNAVKIMLATNGDIPENVNFAIKASVAANFLQSNSVKYEVGEASQQLQPADIADEAKAMSAFIECR
jgi:serine protease Do